MEKKEFLRKIQSYRRKLNRAELVRNLIFALGIGAMVGILFQTAAFLILFYPANIYTILALIFAVVTAMILTFCKRKSMHQTALYMDSFGFQERIITAFEHLEEEGEMLRLQREDAMKQLQAKEEKIKIPVLKSWKQPVVTAGLLTVMVVFMLTPSEMKKQAKELHMVQEEAKEKQEELQEVLDEMEELAEDVMTPEQLAALQEMLESLQSSMQEYEGIESAEALQAANQKLDYKYHNMQSQLENMIAKQMLSSGATASFASMEAMRELAEKMQELGSSGLQDGTPTLAGNQGQNGTQSGDGQQGGGNQGNNGQNPGQDGQNGDSTNNGQNGQNGQGQGQGQGQGSGQGQGEGQGNGQGQGNGEGQGQGNGQGTGEGSGRGEGSGSESHDYVSIPNEIMDAGNLTGNANGHENSDFFRTQNGISWEGNHVSHEAVMGTYEQKAYEGIAAGRYPSGMEEVIKEYFASFN